ncbi:MULTISPECIES: hypothetical protein [unclassified Streptomyces]|uniref:hypothetical protein n=1 Tax=unclassified Streptomyces TaxID=2593676 RepID=UPI003322697D
MPAPPKPVAPPPLQVKLPAPVVTPPPPPPKKPVARPAYRTAAAKRPEHHISPVTFTLMTAAPAVLAIVALRPR